MFPAARLRHHPGLAMTDELIVNLAPTGMVPTRADSPHVPITPEEVAADVRRCCDAGASMVHLHPRDELGAPTQSSARAAEFIVAVRSAGSGAGSTCRSPRSRGSRPAGHGQPDPRIAQLPEAGVHQRPGHDPGP